MILSRIAKTATALAFAATAAAGIATPAAAWQVGNWAGTPMIGSNGQLAGCRMSTPYKSGITLHFIQLSNYALFIGMSRPGWVMNPNGTYNMGLVIDGRYIRRARGVVLHGLTSAIFLNLGTDRVTRDLLARRFKLTLVNNDQNFAFNLTDTAVALQRLEYCVQSGA